VSAKSIVWKLVRIFVDLLSFLKPYMKSWAGYLKKYIVSPKCQKSSIVVQNQAVAEKWTMEEILKYRNTSRTTGVQVLR